MTPLEKFLEKSKEIRALATPGPWFVDFQKPFVAGGAVYSMNNIHADPYGPEGPIEIFRQPCWLKRHGDQPHHNANFVIHARKTSETKDEIIRVLAEALRSIHLGPELPISREYTTPKGMAMYVATWSQEHALKTLSKANELAERGMGT